MLTDREDDLMSPRYKRPRTSLLSSDPTSTSALYSVQSVSNIFVLRLNLSTNHSHLYLQHYLLHYLLHWPQQVRPVSITVV